jgi:hypothetical protein
MEFAHNSTTTGMAATVLLLSVRTATDDALFAGISVYMHGDLVYALSRFCVSV